MSPAHFGSYLVFSGASTQLMVKHHAPVVKVLRKHLQVAIQLQGALTAASMRKRIRNIAPYAVFTQSSHMVGRIAQRYTPIVESTEPLVYLVADRKHERNKGEITYGATQELISELTKYLSANNIEAKKRMYGSDKDCVGHLNKGRVAGCLIYLDSLEGGVSRERYRILAEIKTNVTRRFYARSDTPDKKGLSELLANELAQHSAWRSGQWRSVY